MADGTKRRSPRRLTIAQAATEDIEEIFIWTLQEWGFEQADVYNDFLNSQMEFVAQNPGIGTSIDGKSPIRMWIARWTKATYGHRIFYIDLGTSIQILRIVHTARKSLDKEE